MDTDSPPQDLHTFAGCIRQADVHTKLYFAVDIRFIGFAYYNNGYSHSVLWLPYCVSYTYHFNPLRDSEKDYLKEKADLPEGLLEATAWPIVVTMVAEHRIENHMDTNAGIGHADIPDYADDEDEQGVDLQKLMML